MTEFPQKVLDQIGKELEVTNEKREVIQKGICKEVRWAEDDFVDLTTRTRYRAVQFRLKNAKSLKWTKPFPTDIVKERISNLKVV